MPPLVLDRRRAALVLIGLATLPPVDAAPAPASRIDVSWKRSTGNINDDTQLFEGVVIRQAPGTVISADRARGSGTSSDYDNSHWVLTGKVHIEHDNGVLDAGTATVVFANRLLQSIEVHGAPARFSHPGKAAGQLFNGTASTISFDGTTRQVRFAERSWFSRAGVGEGNSGKPLVYDVDSGALRSETGSDPAAPISVTFSDDSGIEGRFEGAFSLGTGDDTVAGEQVTITQGDGTLITAARAQGSWSGTVADSRWMLAGKVHIEYEKAMLDTDTATVAFANRLIQSMEVRGTPSRFFHPGKVAGRPYHGSADVIAFDSATRQVRFTGRSWYSYGPGEGNSGKPLVYDIDTGTLRSEKVADPDAPQIGVTIRRDRVPTPRTPDRGSAQ